MKNYIPFATLTEAIARKIVLTGKRYVIIQRLAWPDFPFNKTFIVSHFKDLKSAEDHASHLHSKEGKIFDLSHEYVKLLTIINSVQYFVFVANLKEENWTEKLLKAYKSKIISNLKSRTVLRSSEKIDIGLNFINGRLMAQILIGEKELIMPAYDLIK